MYVYIEHNGDESPKKYQGLFLESKGGRCVGLTTLPSSSADWLEVLGASTVCSPTGLSRLV
jgi:hypothetical protein